MNHADHFHVMLILKQFMLKVDIIQKVEYFVEKKLHLKNQVVQEQMVIVNGNILMMDYYLFMEVEV